MASRVRIVLGALGVIVAGAAGYLGVRRMSSSSSSSSPPPSEPAPSSSSGSTAERIIAAAKANVPADYGTPLWDEIMGPKRAPGKWAYYEDHYGTTCGVVAAKILEDAGVGPEYINRAEPGGSGFKIADHIARMQRAGLADGTIIDNAELEPGDVYHATHDNPPGEHVGTVIARDGDTITTADGGQTDANGHQCARIAVRRLSGDTLTRIDGVPAGAMKVTWRLHFAS